MKIQQNWRIFIEVLEHSREKYLLDMTLLLSKRCLSNIRCYGVNEHRQCDFVFSFLDEFYKLGLMQVVFVQFTATGGN